MRVLDADLAMIRAIECVVHLVPDLVAIERAYVDWLGYEVADRCPLEANEARGWHAPALAERPSIALRPQSGESCTLRFIQSKSAADYRALTTYGWSATEIVVQDVDALADRFGQLASPFRIIGGPAGLSRFPMIRAMQVIGPAGECLYLTEVGEGSGLSIAPALSFVGKVFIVVAAGPDADAMFEPYRPFGNSIDPPVATPVAVISAANGLPSDTLHRHGLVRLEGGTLIELDGFPAETVPRKSAPGELPPGMALVRFSVSGLTAPKLICGRGGESIQFVPATGERT